jgi:hypothetical protein
MDAPDGRNEPTEIVDETQSIQITGDTQRTLSFRGPSPVTNKWGRIRLDKIDEIALIAEGSKLLGGQVEGAVMGGRSGVHEITLIAQEGKPCSGRIVLHSDERFGFSGNEDLPIIQAPVRSVPGLGIRRNPSPDQHRCPR